MWLRGSWLDVHRRCHREFGHPVLLLFTISTSSYITTDINKLKLSRRNTKSQLTRTLTMMDRLVINTITKKIVLLFISVYSYVWKKKQSIFRWLKGQLVPIKKIICFTDTQFLNYVNVYIIFFLKIRTYFKTLYSTVFVSKLKTTIFTNIFLILNKNIQNTYRIYFQGIQS